MMMALRFTIIAAALAVSFATSVAGAGTGGPRVDHAWAHATPGKMRIGAVYFTVESPTADRLVGVATPVAGKAELHAAMDGNGMMRMHEVKGGVALPAGGKIELKPGGMHVMLMDLKHPLKAGDSFPLTVTFEKAGAREVMVDVEKMGAMAPGGMRHDTAGHGGMHDGQR